MFSFSCHLNRQILMVKMRRCNFSAKANLVLAGFTQHLQTETPCFFLFSPVYLVNCFRNSPHYLLTRYQCISSSVMCSFSTYFMVSMLVVLRMLLTFLHILQLLPAQTYIILFLEVTECSLHAVVALDCYVILERYLVITGLGGRTAFFPTLWCLYFANLLFCGSYVVIYIFCKLLILLYIEAQ